MAKRVLIAVTHLLGTGHISRATMIADGLGRAGYEVTLVSGGVPVPIVASGSFRFVQLPPVRIFGTDYANLLDEGGSLIDQDYRDRRIAVLMQALRTARPHALITEHFPFGRRQLLNEFIGLIEAARADEPHARVLSSIRDVMIPPTRTERFAEVSQHVASLFDAVLVHGDEHFLPLEKSWPVGASGMAGKLVHTGYISKPPAPEVSEAPSRPAGAGGEVLVSGGGSAAAMPLFRIAVEAALLAGNARRWRVLVGHGVPEIEFRYLINAAAGSGGRLVVERARRDFTTLLAGCAASVSQAGYNTVIDLLHARRPAVLVPYDADSDTDQIIRANAMAEAGLCSVCESAALTPVSLLAAVEAAIARGVPPRAAINLDGVARTAAVIDALLADAPVSAVALARDLERQL